MRIRITLLLVLSAALALANGAAAQTTGAITGTVADEHGRALPGVTVEVTSPNLQGTRAVASDERGVFRFPFLPPGVYRARFTLAGFSTVEQEGITVGLGRTVTLQIGMLGAVEASVTVSGTPPLIDVQSTEVGGNLPSRSFLDLPNGRNFLSVVRVVPGTSNDGGGTMVYGSSGWDSTYAIDGVNTTSIMHGFSGKELNVEFVEEVQAKTAGYQAEYGRSMGGVFNVVTRSGGNAFHGDVFGYYFADSLQASPEVSSATSLLGSGSYLVDSFVRSDLGADLGGFLVKDRLWFFGAYDRVVNDTDVTPSMDYSRYGGPSTGQVYENRMTRDLWAGKFTWRISDSHSLILSAFGDPDSTSGALVGNLAGWMNASFRGLNGEESTFLGEVTYGGTDFVLKYEGLLGSRFAASAQASRHRESSFTAGQDMGSVQSWDYTTPVTFETGNWMTRGGFGIYGNGDFWRDSVRADLTTFGLRLLGDHEVKVGAELERVSMDYSTAWTGGRVISILCMPGHVSPEGCDPGWTLYNHFAYLSQMPPGGATDPDFASYIADAIVVDVTSTNEAVFLQDSWRVRPNLTLNLGLRWEGQKVPDYTGRTRIDLDDNWAPRLGFVWDPKGDGHAKVFGSWGRYFETIPLHLVAWAFGVRTNAAVTSRSPDVVACDPDFADVPGLCYAFGSDTRVVEDLKGESMDEFVLGGEVEAVRNLVVGARFLRRDVGRVVEDALLPDGSKLLGNPGRGELGTVYDFTGTWAYPAAEPKRTFTGVELTARKRFADGWQAQASYLWSKLEGNYDGLYGAALGCVLPNACGEWDTAEWQINNAGYLTSDRRHTLKLDGAYTFPFGLTAGLSAHYRSGVPVRPMGYSMFMGAMYYSLSERGPWGFTDDEYEASLHLGFPFKVGPVRVNVLLDVFNLLNRQGETGRDMNYNLGETIEVIDYATGEVLPPIAAGTPCTAVVAPENAPLCNPRFNTTSTRQDARSVRLGLRLTF